MSKVLFILKRREDYSQEIPNFKYPSVASGMFNSAALVSDMLNQSGVQSDVVTVIDNNCIDAQVSKFRPTTVFIEGYWVVPEKFDILKKIHPSVTWAVRCHSELTFLSQEGVAMEWTKKYLDRGIKIAANSPRMRDDFLAICEFSDNKELPLLPNYYSTENFKQKDYTPYVTVDIACFGALRPLKNQLVQAVAAIAWANKNYKLLRFHVNAGRIETQGGSAIKNIKALFANSRHTLVEHDWAGHEEFLSILSGMDLSLQVSLTESFNIVTADALSVGTPSVVSSEIPFMYPVYARPTSVADIVENIEFVLKHRKVLNTLSTLRLQKYNSESKKYWLAFLDNSEYSTPGSKLLAPAAWKWPVYRFWVRVLSLLT